MVNYDNKTFRSISNSDNGEVSDETIFEYQHEGKMVSAIYSGGNIVFGHLIGLVNDDNTLDIRYHHLNIMGELMTGTCLSVPEILPNGKVRLYEHWTWTSGDGSSGESMVEEV
jgi:hypothetical protein